MKASFERKNQVSILEQLGIDYADSGSDDDDDDDYDDEDPNEMPEWDELDYDPSGTLCKDSRGNIVKAGDYIRMKGSGPNYTPELVTRVFFLGFEDRSTVHRDGWDDCGWKIDTDDGWAHADEVIKVPTPVSHTPLVPPSTP